MYSEEQRREFYDKICEEIAAAKSLRTICEENRAGNKDFPGLRTIMTWLNEDAEFQQQYAHAREEQADHLAQQIVEIADAPVAEFSDDEEGRVAAAASRAEMDRRRLQIDARKWAAGKLKPKVYGDRLQLDGDLNVSVSDEQLESRLAHLLGKAGTAVAAGGTGETEGQA